MNKNNNRINNENKSRTRNIYETVKNNNLIGNISWKVVGIHLIILNLILIAVFLGTFVDTRIIETDKNYYSLFKENNNWNNINNSYLSNEFTNVLIGDKNAKLTIILFQDYDCPYCRKFYNKAYQNLKTDYIDTGKVNIILKTVPIIQTHKNAYNTSMTVLCANEQNKTDLIHNYLIENKITNFDKTLSSILEINDINTTKFNECIQNQKYNHQIAKDIELFEMFKIKTIPTLIIGNQKIEGIKPYFIIQRAIQKELSKEY